MAQGCRTEERDVDGLLYGDGWNTAKNALKALQIYKLKTNFLS